MKYDYSGLEVKWRQKWKDDKLYKVDVDTAKPKYYILDMFPYPSGAGLHVGHPLGYIASDIFSRYKRQKGFNVLHPMGFDAFGLPAEEYALATGIHPADSTAQNIERYKEQLDNIGFSFDWDREIRTCEPEYYKWTQWIFTLLYEHYYDLSADKAESISELRKRFSSSGTENISAFSSEDHHFDAKEWKAYSESEQEDVLSSYRLAFRKRGYVNWCAALGTVLANDQIKDGLSERGGHPVARKAMDQWCLRTTAYAERLLSGLEKIDWSSSLKTIQRNWIGKSSGARIFFQIDGHDDKLEIFTTRADTVFGATYMVVAPEHPLIDRIVTTEQKAAVKDYRSYVSLRSERDRMTDVKEVTGVFTGAYAKHPFTQKNIPIWIGEYVLMEYGTGAIMAVPSDDDRDHAFATKFELEIIEVVDKTGFPDASRTDKVGVLQNSDFLNGMSVKDAIKKMGEEITRQGFGEVKINYKMRDAGFSRQRYWGEPFPIVYKNGIAQTVDSDSLPVTLPVTDDFKPTTDGRSPLSRLTDWVKLDDEFTRETDTMPAVAGSSWYFLRFMDPNNPAAFASAEALDYWQDVDLYVGGAEHAVAHLLYARFWHKFLYDLDYLPTDEPFKRLINQGMIQGVIEFLPMIKDANDHITFVSYDLLTDEMSGHGKLAFIPVFIDYVSDYGSKNSFLSAEGLRSFLEWRPSYKSATFKTNNGHYENSQFLSNEEDFRFVTKSEVGKMSKRYFNVVNPDKVVSEYGADTFRIYEMFLGPIEQSKPWDTQGIEGVSKFVRKLWNLFFTDEKLDINDDEPTEAEFKVLHTAIKKVSEDIEKFSFNTAISAMMICVNELRRIKCNKREVLEPLLKLFAPFGPFTAEELWQLLGHKDSIHKSDYPIHDDKYLQQNSFDYPICINGKKRVMKSFAVDTPKGEIEKSALAMEEVQKWIADKNVVKVIVVPQRMVNIVVK